MKIPFQFVAAGQTFPAGEYKIARLSDVVPRVLRLSSRENAAAVVMFSTAARDTRHDQAKVAFATLGDHHFLSRIETANHVCILSVPRTEALLAATPKKGAASVSPGSN